MARDLAVHVVLLLICWLCMPHRDIGVSAQCNDYSVVGLQDGAYDSCICDVQVDAVPGCSMPPSQEELELVAALESKLNNISSRVELVQAAVEKTSQEMEIAQDDLASMTTKLERIENGDLKVNRPEFDLIIEEIEMLERVLVLLEEDRSSNLETVNALEAELAVVEQELFDLKKTQDVEALLEQIEKLEEDLAECRAQEPIAQPPGSGDDKLFVPWEDKGTQDSCADLVSISSPFTVRTSSSGYGVWMRDPFVNSDLVWLSENGCGSYTYMYRYFSYETFERASPTGYERFTISPTMQGPGAVVYNGSLYYNQYNSRRMHRYDINTGTIRISRDMTNALYGTNDAGEYKGKVCTAFDFAIDEYGLWVIYAVDSYSMKFARLDTTTLESIHTWSLNVPKSGFGNCFLICANLYCVDGYSGTDAEIGFKFDTRTGEASTLNIPLRIRYGALYTLDYNPRDQKLYGWDNGKLVLYDLTFDN